MQVSTLTPLGGYDVQPSSAWVSLEFSSTTAGNKEGRQTEGLLSLLFYLVSINKFVNSVSAMSAEQQNKDSKGALKFTGLTV